MNHRETIPDPTAAHRLLLRLAVVAGLLVLATGFAPSAAAAASADGVAPGGALESGTELGLDTDLAPGGAVESGTEPGLDPDLGPDGEFRLVADPGPDGELGLVADPGVPTPSAAPDPDPFQVEVHGDGRPMILIPGLTSSGDVWDATVAHFSDRYQVHVLTLAGFAGVPPTQSERFLPTQRDAILDYIRREGLERPVIMGHSLGGFLAYWIAATDPDAVGPVVAVDGVPFLPALQEPDADESTMAGRAEQMAAFYASMSEEQMRQQTRMAAQSMVSDASAVDTLAAWGARSDGATAGRAFAEMMTTDLRDEVASIDSPLLLVMAGGGMPEAARERTREAYATQISAAPRSQLVVAADARHFVMLDDPDFLHEAVERFLAEAGKAREAAVTGAAPAPAPGVARHGGASR